jgi:microcystin-dependent protein
MDPFVAEIRINAFNFAPLGWAFCDGQLLPISQNTALFSLLGTAYGGDGKSNFALPDLQGRAPLHPGTGQGLSQYVLGEETGSQNVTLLESEMPAHTHTMKASALPSDQGAPNSARSMARSVNAFAYVSGSPTLVPMSDQAIAPTGSSLPHNNMMPFLTLNFCIALQGVFPQRP